MKKMLLFVCLSLMISCKKDYGTVDSSTEGSSEDFVETWIYWDSRNYAYEFLNEGDAERVGDTILFTYPVIGALRDSAHFKQTMVDSKSQHAFKKIFGKWNSAQYLWKDIWFVFAVNFVDVNTGETTKITRFRYELKPPAFEMPSSGLWIPGTKHS